MWFKINKNKFSRKNDKSSFPRENDQDVYDQEHRVFNKKKKIQIPIKRMGYFNECTTL